MKKEVTRKKVTETTKTLTICDKCGLEAKNPRELYRDVKRFVHDNSYGERIMEFDSHLARVRDHRERRHVGAVRFELPPGEAVIEQEQATEPDVELCESCYDELFSWGE